MNIFDKSLKQKQNFCYKNACEIKKAAISIEPEPEPRPHYHWGSNLRSSKTHSHCLHEAADILSCYSESCRAQGLPKPDQLIYNWTHCLQRLTLPTGVLQEQNGSDPGKGSYSNSCAQHYLLQWYSSQHKLNPNQLSPLNSPAAHQNHIWQQRLPHSQLWYHLSGTKLGTGWGQMPVGPPRKTKRIQYFMDFSVLTFRGHSLYQKLKDQDQPHRVKPKYPCRN